MQAVQLTEDQWVDRGLEIYEQKLKPLLEPEQNGRKVAICVENGDYEVADTTAEAILKLEQRHPDAYFLIAEVGKPVAEWPWSHAADLALDEHGGEAQRMKDDEFIKQGLE